MPVFAKWAGLHTSHNYVGSVPEGAMSVATNCVIRSQDTIEPRRGQASVGYTFGSGSQRIREIFKYGTSRIIHYGTIYNATILALDTGSAFSDYSGTYTAVDAAFSRMRGVEAAQNFYVNTNLGVKVLDSTAGSFSSAGVPQALDISLVGGTVSASGVLASDRAVAYRNVWVQQDANSQKRQGAPSQRTVVTNTPIVIPTGGLVRDTNVVTVQLQTGDESLKYLAVGDVLTIATTDTDFDTAPLTRTIASISTSANQFTYAEAEPNDTSTAAATFSSTRNNKIAVSIPAGMGTSDICNLYRTATAPTAATDPGDEAYQIAEQSPPAAQTVTAGGVVATGTTVVVTKASHPFVKGQTVGVVCTESFMNTGSRLITATTGSTFTFIDPSASNGTSANSQTFTALTLVFDDDTPDEMLGDPLYTNPNTGDGIEASNYEPPIGKDMCFAFGQMWWANTTSKHRLSLQLLGTGTGGLVDGDTIRFRVSSTNYDFLAEAGDATLETNEFRLHSYDSSPAVNVERTALDLVRCINQRTLTAGARLPFYAVYVSAQNDVPGKIMLIESAIGGSAISSTTDRIAAFSPTLPTLGTATTVSSSNDADEAGLIWSKVDQPEAVPLANKLRVDAKNDPIMRIAALRDSLFVFKKLGGVWVVPNGDPKRVIELDKTCQLIAPDTVVSLNNQLYCLTRQGLCTVTEAGVDIIGWPVDHEFDLLDYPLFLHKAAFSVAYESERALLMFVPASETTGATGVDQAYVYNHATRAFTRWTMSRSAGLVMPGEDVLYLGDGESRVLLKENKAFTWADYTEGSVSVTVNTDNGTSLVLASASGVTAGDLLTDGTRFTQITAVDSNTITVEDDLAWAATPFAATVYVGYTCEAQTVPLALGTPGTGKSIARAVYTFRDSDQRLGKAVIWTDEEAQTEHALLDGGPFAKSNLNLIAAGPDNKHLTLGTMGSFARLGFKIREAGAAWKLLAITAEFDEQADRGLE